jgi:hypothetical protein
MKVGAHYENNPSLSVSGGQLLLQQEEISRTFEAVIERTIERCHMLVGDHDVKVRSISQLNIRMSINFKYLLLVGEFGESLYLLKMLEREFKAMGVSLITSGDIPPIIVSYHDCREYISQPLFVIFSVQTRDPLATLYLRLMYG